MNVRPPGALSPDVTRCAQRWAAPLHRLSSQHVVRGHKVTQRFPRASASPETRTYLGVSSWSRKYTAANATVYRVYEYAVPVTTVATVPSAYPTTAGLPGIAAYPAGGWGCI